MILPPQPWIDPKTGNPTPAFAQFMQALATGQGEGGHQIIHERVSNTVVRRKLKGTDGVWRVESNVTLS